MPDPTHYRTVALTPREWNALLRLLHQHGTALPFGVDAAKLIDVLAEAPLESAADVEDRLLMLGCNEEVR